MIRRDQLNRRVHQISAAAETERPPSPQVIQQGRAVRTGGGGGGGLDIAYCKEDAPDADTITCYIGEDLIAWSGATTYATDDWVEVAGTEYKSLQDDNTNHAVSETDWWEEGTLSVSVTCLIANGSSLLYASPVLKDGQDIPVMQKDDVWYCTNLFTGAKFGSFGV